MNLIASIIILIFLILTCVLGVVVFKSMKNNKRSEDTGRRDHHEPVMLYPSEKTDFKSRVTHAFYYILVSSPETGASKPIALAQGKNVFGRSRSFSNFVIDDECISRTHFVIYVNKDKMIIEDYKSTNGTLLNGEKLDSTPKYLKVGDEICVGKTKFIVGATAEK